MDHAQQAIDMIDRALEAPPVGIDEALQHAIARGRMTIKEAEECRELYYRQQEPTDGQDPARTAM